MTDVNYMLVWIAVQSLSPDQALASLDMAFSSGTETCDMPGWPDFINRRDYHDRIFIGQLAGDWLLLFGNLDEEDKARLVQLAEFGPAFSGEISRIGNFAEGRGYADGEETWRVDYDLESRGPDDPLKIEGSVPRHLAAIIAEARAAYATGAPQDADVEVLIEVPGRLSKAICGFSPHEAPPAGFRWSMLQPIGGVSKPEPKSKGWLASLFGRK
jgi:hypothetical protein